MLIRWQDVRKAVRSTIRLLVCLMAALILAGCMAATASFGSPERDEDVAPDELAHQPWRPGYQQIIDDR